MSTHLEYCLLHWLEENVLVKQSPEIGSASKGEYRSFLETEFRFS
jgi:hypothetical protein